MKRFILLIYSLLCTILLFSQKVVTVNAQIETKYQVWTLDSIKLNEEDTDLYWHVESKGYTWCHVNTNTYLQVNSSENRYYLKDVNGIAQEPDSTIMNDYEVLHFIENFPVHLKITDSIDLFANENFYIKGISLKTGRYNEIPKFQRYIQSELDSIKLSKDLFKLGMELHAEKKYLKALETFKRVNTIDSLLFSVNGLNNLISWIGFNNNRLWDTNYTWDWIAECYYKLGENDKAKYYSSQFMGSAPFDRDLVVESDSLRVRYPSTSVTPKNKEKYIDIYKRICKLDSINLGANSLRHIESLCNLADIYKEVRMYDLAISTYLQAMQNAKKYSFRFSKILYNLSQIYYSIRDYDNAVKYIEEYYQLNNNELYSTDTIDRWNRFQLIRSYIAIGQYEEALDILKKMIFITEKEKSSDKLNINYIDAVRDYADILTEIGFHKEALRQYKIIEDINYFGNLKLGTAYLNSFNYDKAEEYFIKELNLYNNRDSILKFVSSYVDIYSNLASLEYRRGNTDKAIHYQSLAIKKVEEQINNKNTSFLLGDHYTNVNLMSNLSLYYLVNNEIDKAIDWEMKNLDYKKVYFIAGSPYFGYSHINLGEAYFMKKEYETALRHTILGYNLLAKDSIDKRRALTNMVKNHFILNKKSEAEKYLLELNRINNQRMKSLFTELTYHEKKNFLDKQIRFYTDFLPRYTAGINSDTLKTVLYDGILLSKGALLSSDIGLRKFIKNSNDSIYLEDYNRLQFYKRSIIKELKNNRSSIIIDSLSNIANELEDSLILKSKVYGNYLKNQSITWKDIRSKLSSRCMAIEFIDFQLENDSMVYAALVLKKDYKAPKLITLCNSDLLENLDIKDTYTSPKLDNIIWKPLKEELKDVDNIYFSPFGLLHNIAIELSPSMKKKNLYRLSTTREIATSEINKENIKTAALFGGMKYNSKAKNRNIKYDFKSLSSTRGLEDIPDRGLSFSELPLTGVEVYNAEKFLKGSKYECFSFIGKDGIEESFKSLSGQNINWIHLATHGGYIAPETNQVKNNNYNFIIDLDKDIFSEDISLTHSFLAFSGCNSALKGNTIPENSEDGILTAQEISQLDLSKLDLVILSACKTGLGNISEDGVYGLQRGFKKAGAKSILMSLWDVNDKAAYEYMTFFYEFYAQKKNIKYAYDMAQKNMRKKYPNNPEYWAAFILLDGV